MLAVSWIAIGLVLGVAARLLKRGNSLEGWFAGPLIGIGGALLIGWVLCIIMQLRLDDPFNVPGLLFGAIGALITLTLWSVQTRRRI